MKKILFYLVLTLFVGQISAQSRMVQGIERPDLQNKSTKAANSLRTNTSFTLDDIDFWVGDGENRAALVISWHDNATGLTDDLVWGYRWPAGTKATGFKMIEAVALKDPRFLLLTQNTNSSTIDSLGYTIDGIGYDNTNRNNIKLKYILGQKEPFIKGASTDSRISFKFEKPYSMSTQKGHPSNPQHDADSVIAKGQSTGVIYHPFDGGTYGYACYDYDYWQVDAATNAHWVSGWYNGYWSYYVRGDNTSDFGYSSDGATRRELSNGDWDAWSYSDINSWGTQPGEVFTAAPAIVKVNIKSITLEKNATIPLALTIDKAYTSGGNASWTSTPSNIVLISNKSNEGATIKALKAGKTYVKVTVDGYSAFCDITVVDKVSAAATTTANNIQYIDNTLHIKNLSGYTAYVSSISGNVVSTYRIVSADEIKTLNLAPGIYSITAVKGTEKVSQKFVVK